MSRGQQDGDQCRGGGLAPLLPRGSMSMGVTQDTCLPSTHYTGSSQRPSGRGAAVDSEVGAWLCCPRAGLGSVGLCIAHARAPGAPHVGIW